MKLEREALFTLIGAGFVCLVLWAITQASGG